MTTKQGCYFYAIKRVDDNTYYNYLYKNFMKLHQTTKLYSSKGRALAQFDQCLKSMYYKHLYHKIINNDLKFSDFLEQNKDKLQVATLWLGEI